MKLPFGLLSIAGALGASSQGRTSAGLPPLIQHQEYDPAAFYWQPGKRRSKIVRSHKFRKARRLARKNTRRNQV